MPTIHRRSRSAFRFSGPEAQKLLFDVVTGRVTAEPGPAVWWALLSPQGKIQAEGLCGWADDAFWLDVDSTVADTFLKRMRMYRLRAAVEIDDLRDSHVVGWSDDPTGGGIRHADARGGGMGARIILPKGMALADEETAFAAARIEHGIAELGPDFPPDSTFPHDIGMDLLQGIDFRKGCYVGQEVVSRMQHRGSARRRPVIVSGPGLAAGDSVLSGEREAGRLGAVGNGKAVAILRLDRIVDLDAVTVGGRPVVLTLPPWATYSFGETTAEA